MTADSTRSLQFFVYASYIHLFTLTGFENVFPEVYLMLKLSPFRQNFGEFCRKGVLSMRQQYMRILKIVFYNNLIATRTSLNWTQAQMAERLAMDDRSYIELDHGNSCCGALTLALYLVYCCEDPIVFIGELKSAFETGSNYAA